MFQAISYSINFVSVMLDIKKILFDVNSLQINFMKRYIVCIITLSVISEIAEKIYAIYNIYIGRLIPRKVQYQKSFHEKHFRPKLHHI